ncbi:hypothetical protein EON63_24465 [archaeon]|nr:MAG: hypothetical protein EON63_24465 [archaeon]
MYDVHVLWYVQVCLCVTACICIGEREARQGAGAYGETDTAGKWGIVWCAVCDMRYIGMDIYIHVCFHFTYVCTCTRITHTHTHTPTGLASGT